MKIVGITGGIASGKSSVSTYLLSKGQIVIDCDKLTDTLYTHDYFTQGLYDLFGKKIMYNNAVNRGKIGKLVFENRKQLAVLNNYCKKFLFSIIVSLVEEYREQGHSIIFIDAPTLFESGLNVVIDFSDIWVVSVSKGTQMARLKRRKRYLTYKAIDNILNSQLSNEERRSRATFVLDNNTGTKELLYARVDYGLNILLNEVG